MERRTLLIIAIACALALVAGLAGASAMGYDFGFLSGNIITQSPYPP